MRQTGVLAACAAYALTHNFPLLPRVHALAQRLEQGLEDIGVEITSRAETCMVGISIPLPLVLCLTKCSAILQSFPTRIKLLRDRRKGRSVIGTYPTGGI